MSTIMKRNLAPIALFCFNRPDLLGRTLTALAANVGACESHIAFFCDGPRHAEEKSLTDAVRTLAHNAQGFASVTVVEREQNMGCAASIIDGLKYMFDKYEKVIVIEDDILTSVHTLAFLNAGLALYEHEKSVFSISAWSPPGTLMPISSKYPYSVYANLRFNCWGWASWRDRIEHIDWDVKDYITFKNDTKARADFNQGGEDLTHMLDSQMDGKSDTWDIRADYHRFKSKQISINPVFSYTTNIGFSSGTHTTQYTNKFDNNITKALPVQNISWLENITLDAAIVKAHQQAYSPPLWHRCVRSVLSFLGLWRMAKALKEKLR